jgi:hypothetical protein
MKTQLAAHRSAVDKLVNKTKQPNGTIFPALDPDVNELFLFHGTDTDETGRTIAVQGLTSESQISTDSIVEWLLLS